MRVLVLEKRPEIASNFKHSFDNIKIAETVKEAEHALKFEKFDIIFIDQHGIKLAERIFNRTTGGFGVPTIIYSTDIIDANRILNLLPYAAIYPYMIMAHDLCKYAQKVYEHSGLHQTKTGTDTSLGRKPIPA